MWESVYTLVVIRNTTNPIKTWTISKWRIPKCSENELVMKIRWHSWQAHGRREGSNEIKRRHYNFDAEPKPRRLLYWQHKSCIYAEGHNYIHICGSVNPKKNLTGIRICGKKVVQHKTLKRQFLFIEDAWCAKHAIMWFGLYLVNYSAYIYQPWQPNTY